MVAILGANSVSGGYEIDNSLRFNDNDSAKLGRTPSSAGNKKTFTFSSWFKRGSIGIGIQLFDANGTGSTENDFLKINSNDTMQFRIKNSNSVVTNLIPTQVFRDPSAWYHIVLAWDTTQSTESNRVKIYLNGSQITDFSTASYPTQNLETSSYNNTVVHSIGAEYYSGSYYTYYDGYMAETHFIDGTAKAPTDFGKFNDNGVWIPKAYTGSYGTNGFYLEFKQTGTGTDASGIGADTSGNDNHFAVTNLAALDVMPDTPTNNWCTYNPLDLGQASSGPTFSQGNLTINTPTSYEDNVGSTFGVSSGKWYWETKIQSSTAREAVGAKLVGTGLTGGASVCRYFSRYGTITLLGSSVVTGATFGNNDVISMTLDLDNNVIKFFKNNVLQGTVNSVPAGTWVPTYCDASDQIGAQQATVNFGQDGTFAGAETAQGNADENGYGNFKYAVPSGFYSLCTKNLAEFG